MTNISSPRLHITLNIQAYLEQICVIVNLSQDIALPGTGY